LILLDFFCLKKLPFELNNSKSKYMPNKLIDMNKIRQVLRLYAAGKGTKTISSVLNISRNTVKKYLRISQQSSLSFEELLSLDDADLFGVFQEKKEELPAVTINTRYDTLQSLLPEYCKRLKKRGVTRQMLHAEYLLAHPDGYGRSRFGTFIQAYQASSTPIMHLEHKAGDKMYIDYAGDKLSIIDSESGEILSVEVFVAILPCSQLTYVEAVMSQRKEDLIKACENALLFYGGTPLAIVPDNLKAAVKRSSRYEAELNDDFASFASHYGCTVMPARAYKPRDMALVEGAVKLIYRSIYPTLEERKFFDLLSLNIAIRIALELHNNAPMVGRTYSRRQQYEDIERDCMGRLNPVRFALKQRLTATVMKNGHIRVDKHYYSVPYKYIGKQVKVLYNDSVVEVYFRYVRLASHTRSYKPFHYTTDKEHLASNHRFATEWTPEGFIAQARTIHPDVEAYIRGVLEEKTHPEQAYKSCKGILSFAARVGEKRLINACRWGMAYGLYNYPAIEKILKNRQDELPLEEDKQEQKTAPSHENIRG
jgi:transposase